MEPDSDWLACVDALADNDPLTEADWEADCEVEARAAESLADKDCEAEADWEAEDDALADWLPDVLAEVDWLRDPEVLAESDCDVVVDNDCEELWLVDANWLFAGGMLVAMKTMFGVPIGIAYDPRPQTVTENSV